MKKSLKVLVAAMAVLALAVPDVYAAPVKMTLTYDGKTHQYNAESIDLRVNGSPIELPVMPPIILEGRTYVPSREVFEPLGATVDWKAASKEVYIGYNGTLVVLKPDSKTADVNGVFIPLENPAKIINEKLMIPARFVAEQLGIAVNWDPKNRIVSIGNEPEQPQEQPPAPSDPVTPSVPFAPSVPSEPASGISVDISSEPLTRISGQAVKINNFSADKNIFTITATDAISRVEKLLLPENKLVLDIYNATNALSSNSYASSGFSGVTSVRNSQFQTSPENITRIVFDLTGSNKFSVSMSGDRKKLIVEFEENKVLDVLYGASYESEQVTVSCLRQPLVSPSRMFSPDRLVFDVVGADYAAGFSEKEADGRFIQKIRASQFEPGTARIVLDLKADAQYKIEYTGNNAVITLTEPTYKSIKYVQQPGTTLTLSGAEGISASQVIHNDEYMNGRYVLTLPGDYTDTFGYGTFEINDSVFHNITVQNYNGNTELVFSQKNIMAYSVVNDGSDLLIKPLNPKEVYPTVVYLDAGHGGSDPGASAGGYQEKNLNLNIVLRIYELLEKDPEIKVYLWRNDDRNTDNMERVRLANYAADLFLSIHHNSAESTKSNGTEVLFLNHEGEAYPRISSEAVARIIQTNLSRDIDTTDRGVVKRTNLIILNQTKIPAVIVEVAFLSNAGDLAKVAAPEVRQTAAESIYRSVKEIFTQYPTGRR